MQSYFGQKQQGMTFISVVFILTLIAIVTLLTLKVAPIYLEYNDVYTSLQALKKDDLSGMTPGKIRSLLQKKLDVNMVDSVSVEDISVIKKGKYVKVDVDYEVIEHLVGNIDLLIYFNDAIEVGEN